MAIFRETEAFIDRVDALRARVDAVVDTLSDAVERVWNVLDVIRARLAAAEGALSALGRAIDRAADAIRRIPAPGVWRVIPVIASGILEGIARAIKVLKEGVEALREAMRGRRLRRVEELLEKLQDVLDRYSEVSTRVQSVLHVGRRICQLLEKQQDAIERAFPALPPEIRRLLAEWTQHLPPVEQVIRELEAGAATVEGAIDELDRVLALVDGIDALQRAVEGRLGSLVDAATTALRAVGDLIMSIPFVGWFLDKLNELIDWALEQLGIQAALDAIGAQIRSLPFFDRIQRFIDSLEAAVNQVEQALQTLEQVIADAEAKLRDFEQRAKDVIERMTGVSFDKLKLESFLPQWLLDARSKFAELRERLQSTSVSPAEIGEVSVHVHKHVKRICGAVEGGPHSGFGEEIFATLRPITGELREQLAASEARPEDPELLLVMEPGLVKMHDVLAPYASHGAEMPEGYFDELRTQLGQTEIGATCPLTRVTT